MVGRDRNIEHANKRYGGRTVTIMESTVMVHDIVINPVIMKYGIIEQIVLRYSFSKIRQGHFGSHYLCLNRLSHMLELYYNLQVAFYPYDTMTSALLPINLTD